VYLACYGTRAFLPLLNRGIYFPRKLLEGKLMLWVMDAGSTKNQPALRLELMSAWFIRITHRYNHSVLLALEHTITAATNEDTDELKRH
jgi:hypothetical protein